MFNWATFFFVLEVTGVIVGLITSVAAIYVGLARFRGGVEASGDDR
jgi:hypothetical protein